MISYKRGHNNINVIVDHDSGRLVWVASGKDRAAVATFFDFQRCAQISHVSMTRRLVEAFPLYFIMPRQTSTEAHSPLAAWLDIDSFQDDVAIQFRTIDGESFELWATNE